jgi:hypothetical protein
MLEVYLLADSHMYDGYADRRMGLVPPGPRVNRDGTVNTYRAWRACGLTGPRCRWAWPIDGGWVCWPSSRHDSVPATFPRRLGEWPQTVLVPRLRRQHRDSYRGRGGTLRLWKSKHPGVSPL